VMVVKTLDELCGYMGTKLTGHSGIAGIGAIIGIELFIVETVAPKSVYSSLNKGIAINSGDITNPTVFSAGVDFSVALGGTGLTVKTNNAAYCNQLVVQITNSAFQTLIDSNPLTADRVQTLQDKDGEIALTSDINTPVIFKTFADTPYAAAWGEDIEVDCTAGNVVINLPQSVGNNGKKISITRVDGTANTLTVNTFAGETLNGAATFAALVTQYDSLTAKANGTVSYYWR